MEFVTLNNGIKMPKVGIGLYQVNNNDAEKCVKDAISVGYRLIDTAQCYENEEGVGKAIKACSIPRDELFITSKIWIDNTGYRKAMMSIDKSLKQLKTDYIDLMLIHEPYGDYYGAYKAMIKAYQGGKIRAIGVSNFSSDRLIDLCKFQEIIPAINQVETHIYNQQLDEHGIMKKYGVQHEAWAPFSEGKTDVFNEKLLIEIANMHKKTVPQVILRYLIQNDIVVIPKTINKSRLIENINIFDFELSISEVNEIKNLDRKEQLLNHCNAEVVEGFFSSI